MTIGLVLLIIAVVGIALFLEQRRSQQEVTSSDQQGPVAEALLQLPVKGKAPKTGYSRQQFSDGWGTDGASGCSVRNVILQRDLTNTQVRQTSEGRCNVVKGQLQDPYTGKQVAFDKTAGDAKRPLLEFRLIMWWHYLMLGKLVHRRSVKSVATS